MGSSMAGLLLWTVLITFSLEMLSLLPMISAIRRRLSGRDSIAVKQSSAWRWTGQWQNDWLAEQKTLHYIHLLYCNFTIRFRFSAHTLTSRKTCCAVAAEALSKLSQMRSHHFSRSLWKYCGESSGVEKKKGDGVNSCVSSTFRTEENLWQYIKLVMKKAKLGKNIQLWLKGFHRLMKWFFRHIHIVVYRKGVMEIKFLAFTHKLTKPR